MKGDDAYKDIVWLLGLAGAAFGLYWAYQNGMLGYFAQCPAGFTASGGTCVNSTGLQTAPSGSPPSTPLEPGMEWDGLDSGSGCRAGMESNNYVMRLFLYVLRSVAGLRARVAILLARRRHSPLVLGFIGGNA